MVKVSVSTVDLKVEFNWVQSHVRSSFTVRASCESVWQFYLCILNSYNSHSHQTRRKCPFLRWAHSLTLSAGNSFLFHANWDSFHKKITKDKVVLLIQLPQHWVVMWLLRCSKLTFPTHVDDFNPLASTQHLLLLTTIEYHPHITEKCICC